MANELNLSDMSGNVYEWVWDWYAYSYSSGELTDPAGPASGTSRVVRGGSCNDGNTTIGKLSVAYRSNGSYGGDYYVGFRVLAAP
jgi:formylglycine-generating enzyme required for sulfatase activity